MQIIEGQRVDLISPFPLHEAKRVFGWMRCYKSVVDTDLSPKTAEEFEGYLKDSHYTFRSYGVIDKFNECQMKHEAPLIGFVAFEPHTNWNGYFHIASTRSAWGKGLFDEGVQLAITDMFSALPDLLRVSALIMDKNYPARKLAERLGFQREGFLKDMVLQDKQPKTLVHYGLTRASLFSTELASVTAPTA